MSQDEQVTIDLPAATAEKVREAIESGEYASAGEVMRAALRLWEDRRELRSRDVEALRSLYDEGKASGIVGPLDMPRILNAAKERAKAAKSG